MDTSVQNHSMLLNEQLLSISLVTSTSIWLEHLVCSNEQYKYTKNNLVHKK